MIGYHIEGKIIGQGVIRENEEGFFNSLIQDKINTVFPWYTGTHRSAFELYLND